MTKEQLLLSLCPALTHCNVITEAVRSHTDREREGKEKVRQPIYNVYACSGPPPTVADCREKEKQLTRGNPLFLVEPGRQFGADTHIYTHMNTHTFMHQREPLCSSSIHQ